MVGTVETAVLLRAFGDGTRLRILSVLAQEQMSVGALADILQCPFHRVSRHLHYLGARGMVESFSQENSVVYRLSPGRSSVGRRVLPVVLEILKRLDDVRDDTARLNRGGSV